MRQLHDLARGPDTGPGYGWHDAAIEELGETLAEPAGHGRVAGQERQQPHSDDRPHLGSVQPRRTAGGPRKQQVALVGTLLLLSKADSGQRPHAGVNAIHRPPVAERRPRLGAALLHHVKQARPDADRPAVGNCADELEIGDAGLGDHQSGHG